MARQGAARLRRDAVALRRLHREATLAEKLARPGARRHDDGVGVQVLEVVDGGVLLHRRTVCAEPRCEALGDALRAHVALARRVHAADHRLGERRVELARLVARDDAHRPFVPGLLGLGEHRGVLVETGLGQRRDEHPGRVHLELHPGRAQLVVVRERRLRQRDGGLEARAGSARPRTRARSPRTSGGTTGPAAG